MNIPTGSTLQQSLLLGVQQQDHSHPSKLTILNEEEGRLRGWSSLSLKDENPALQKSAQEELYRNLAAEGLHLSVENRALVGLVNSDFEEYNSGLQDKSFRRLCITFAAG